MKKPTGKIGPYKVHIDETGSPRGIFEKVAFSGVKDDIENYIVSCFMKSAKKTFREYFFISNPQKNQLDDFDFSVTTPKGKADLELMEVAPLQLHEGGHERAPNSYDRYKLAEFIHSKIIKKSEKYPDNLSGELFLLLYVTNFKFALSDATLQILRYFCHKSFLKFDVIFLYTPLDETEGHVEWIHPMEESDFEGFDPEQYRGVVLNLNPEKFEVTTDKKS